MFAFEDIAFQLVDLPPISASFMEPWMPNALQLANAALLIVDLSIPGCVENTVAIRKRLEEKRISLVAKWRGTFDQDALDVAGQTDDPKSASQETHFEDDEEIDDTFRIRIPTLLVASKSDLEWDKDEIDVFEELIGVRYPAVSISLETGEGLDRIGPLLFQGLGIVRVYTKIPGRPADRERPYTLFYGETVHDVATLVHRDLAESLKFARIWGSAKFDGQQVGKDHIVRDGDIIELHG
jgi:ribosome-interacting GTPase 1